MDTELLLGSLRSACVNTADVQLKLKTIPTDNWLISRVVFITHEIEIEGQLRTELLVFPDSVERNLPQYEISSLVKIGLDAGRHDYGVVIHVIPQTTVTFKSDTFERAVKRPRQPFDTQRINICNPYLLDFLKNLRNEDGGLVVDAIETAKAG